MTMDPRTKPGRRLGGLAAFILASVSLPAEATFILVNDAGDTLHDACALTGASPCTLRDAITFANAHAGLDGIGFPDTIAGTIHLNSPLPVITDPVSISGGGQERFGTDIDGSMAGPTDGLTIAADGCSLSALSVRGFEGSGIVVTGSNNRLGSPTAFLYSRSAGVYAAGNGGHGIEVRGGSGNLLNFASAANNRGHGIYIHSGAKANVIGDDSGGGRDPGLAGSTDNLLAGIRIGDGPSDSATQANTIFGLRALYGNGGPGIDLGGYLWSRQRPLGRGPGPERSDRSS